jgi:hypothetical protein
MLQSVWLCRERRKGCIMKKFFLIVVVLMLTTPAWAAPTVNIWADQNDLEPNKVDIWYDVNPDPATGVPDGNRPRAFGLRIWVNDGNIIDINVPFEGECDDVNRGYGIFPGTITIADGVPGPWGSPIAPDDDPGAEGTGLDTNTIVIEMGSLYTGANTPDPCAILLSVVVSRDCNVCIGEDVTRAGTGNEGVVLENPAISPTDVVFACSGEILGVSRYVPNVLPLDLTEATYDIEANDLVVGDVTYECNDTEVADEVLSQDPAGGTEVEEGSEVDLVISLGSPVVPDVVGDTNAAAQAAINAVTGLSVGDITTECNDTIADGNVISTDPPAGVTTCGTDVNIVISTGPCAVECYAGMADYSEWDAVGKPNCWCYPRQCHGDADGYEEAETKKVPAHWVGDPDIGVLASAWKKGIDDVKYQTYVGDHGAVYLACADFDHTEEPETKKVPAHRVGDPDIAILASFWKGNPNPDPNCQPGNLSPP